ncbi:MAG: hypothetical protein N4A36_03730 [Candidatus Gracilibacteria bacterium]|jgi:hypothetical protein|nr:hypothetical protein [Candidatus Gracilibacteria bacterium]
MKKASLIIFCLILTSCSFFENLPKDKNELLGLAKSTDKDSLIEKIIAKNDIELNLALLVNPNLDIEDFKKIKSSIQKGDFLDFVKSTSNKAILTYLIEQNQNSINANLAKNPATPYETLLFFADKAELLSSLAENSVIKDDIVNKIAEKGNDTDLRILLGNSALSKDKLTEIIENKNSASFYSAALINPNMDLELYSKIKEKIGAEDENLINLALNTKDEGLLTLLSEHQNRAIRAYLAKNPATPKDILDKYLEENDDIIVNYMATNKAITIDIQNIIKINEDEMIRAALAKNPNLDQSVMLELSKDRSMNVLKKLIENENITDESLLSIIDNQTQQGIFLYILKQESVSEEIVKKLYQKDNQKIKDAAKVYADEHGYDIN